jgi:HAD superfamily phosphatase (TIGR01681 family)
MKTIYSVGNRNNKKKNKKNKVRKNTRDNKKIVKSKLNYKVYVFDLDNTLYLHYADQDYSIHYHKRVKEFLETLKARGNILCIATHNKQPKNYLDRMDIYDLFDHIIFEKQEHLHPYLHCIQDYTPKNEMIEEILHLTECKKEQVVFFDDFDYNVKQVESVGVKSIKVCDTVGLIFDDILKLN